VAEVVVEVTENAFQYLFPNEELKHDQRVALNWTPSTGAASHYRAGFSRRLALR